MAAALDTLRFSQRLQQAGVSREQADAHAELARDMVLAELATKDDLAALKGDLKGDISTLKGDFKGDISATRNDLNTTKNDLLAAIREVELKVTIKCGAMIAAGVGIIIAAQRFL